MTPKAVFMEYSSYALAALAVWVTLRCARCVLFARSDGAEKASPALTALLLTLFQLTLLLQLSAGAGGTTPGVLLAFGVLMAAEWGTLFLERGLGLRGFTPETVAFFLTGVGFAVAASSRPGAMAKQSALFLAGLGAYLLLTVWLRRSAAAMRLRLPAALGSLGILAVTLAIGTVVHGAKGWISVSGGYVFQPSEFVKVAYVYAGSAAMEKASRRDLVLFTVFSAGCVGLLALMGDFGTALVFFCAFLIIAWLRSGSLLLEGAALAAAAGAVAAVLKLRPYVAARFASWGHAWADPLGRGFQQVRAMSALAAGGLFGRGAGAGWLRGVVAADTDLVFALVGEELGLITALCCVALLLLLAVLAARSPRRVHSSYFAVAGCAAATICLAQMGLNVFGSLDILPFTGVTFPFVSRGGSSLIACWGLLSFFKAGELGRPTKKTAPGKTPPSPDKKPAGRPATSSASGRKTPEKTPGDKKAPGAKKTEKTKTPAPKSADKPAPAKKPAEKKTPAQKPAEKKTAAKPSDGAKKAPARSGRKAGT